MKSQGLIGWAVVLVLLTAACITDSTTGTVVEYRVSGYVHAGPVCPVEQDPPDPECTDKPVVGAELHVVNASGDTVGEISTDSSGRFESLLPAGAYTLVPQPVEGLMGTAPAQDFSIGPSGTPELDIAYDTGIR